MMKTFLAVSLLSLGALAAEKTETIKVSGWHCGGCAARTEAALKDVKGVQTVAADKTKKSVTVTYDDTKVARADLDKAITESGFEVAK
jgi:Cu+-exporting ATPase